jgi:hypothetical protein
MSKQIFRTIIPKELLYTLLDKISLKTDKYYLIDMNSYKRIKFYNLQDEFLSNISEHYQYSKKFYVERPFTYNSFTNIVRQICKSNNLTFTSKIKYNESKYNIEFYVYHLQTNAISISEKSTESVKSQESNDSEESTESNQSEESTEFIEQSIPI